MNCAFRQNGERMVCSRCGRAKNVINPAWGLERYRAPCKAESTNRLPVPPTKTSRAAPTGVIVSNHGWELLDELDSTIAIVSHGSNRLRLLSAVETRDIHLPSPQTLAFEDGRLAIGYGFGVHEFGGRPLSLSVVHSTCAIRARDAGWTKDGLAVLDLNTSAVVVQEKIVWQSSFAPGQRDCCHFNGLAVVDGKARYVTALSQASETNGWRAKPHDSGILLDIQTDEIVVSGLSLPHTPRWHEGRLWLLESGNGSCGLVDLKAGRYEPIIRLPGFTCGLVMVGDLALVGLSPVRQSKAFGGFRMAGQDRLVCGIAAVDLNTGGVVGISQTKQLLDVYALALLPGQGHEIVIPRTSFLAPSVATRSTRLAKRTIPRCAFAGEPTGRILKRKGACRKTPTLPEHRCYHESRKTIGRNGRWYYGLCTPAGESVDSGGIQPCASCHFHQPQRLLAASIR